MALDGLVIGGVAAGHMRRTYKQMQEQSVSMSVSEARLQAEGLAVDVDRLFMITQALWELLKEKHGYTDESLMKKITEIDLRDGKLDGKTARKERPNCPSCGRKMGRHPTCLYCGAEAPDRCPFDR